MQISASQGNITYYSTEKIVQMIRQSAASVRLTDDIWISGTSEYPCLCIMVNGDYTCIHYFADGNGTMWQSFSEFQKEIVFLAGGEEWSAPADTIVSLEKAIQCAEMFCSDLKRPACIEWQSL